MIPVHLGLYNIPGNEHNFSEFSKNPERYGITVSETGMDADWHHDIMDRDQAKLLAQRMASKNVKAGIDTKDPWEWTSRQVAPTNNDADLHIKNYILRKKKLLTKI